MLGDTFSVEVNVIKWHKVAKVSDVNVLASAVSSFLLIQ